MQLLKFLVDGPPDPTINFIWISAFLMLLYAYVLFSEILKKNLLRLIQLIIGIPLFTFFHLVIGAAYGTFLVLDAMANIPVEQRFQALATGLVVSIQSMFLPSIFIIIEIVLTVVVAMIKIPKTFNKIYINKNDILHINIFNVTFTMYFE